MLRRMRWVWMVATLLAFAGTGLEARAAAATVGVAASFGSRGPADVSIFYQSLSPYGDWISYAPYGWVWAPTAVAADWRPYSDGYWVYTDYGWTWVDDEPWGWGPMHYGRWVWTDDAGWLWVPGTVWGPAWVAWAISGDDIGWAPLPPDMAWNTSVTFADFDVRRVPERAWCFAPTAALTSTSLRSRIVPVSRNRSFMTRATNLTRFGVRGGMPVDLGLDTRRFQRLSGHAVTRMRLTDQARPGRAAPAGNTLALFRPRVTGSPAIVAPPQRVRHDVRDVVDRRRVGGGRTRGPHAVPSTRARLDRSASAARNQDRQRFGVRPSRNATPPPPPAPPPSPPSRDKPARGPAVRNRNGFPQSTYQQPAPDRGVREHPNDGDGRAGSGDPSRGDGKGRDHGD